MYIAMYLDMPISVNYFQGYVAHIPTYINNLKTVETHDLRMPTDTLY